MKKNYTKMILSALICFMGFISYSQDIHFTFANTQNTNDGVDDFYEVDVMIQTINSTGTFKLGSGQLYFTYSTAAFGNNVSASGGISVTHPDGYICGQAIDLLAAIKIYSNPTVNDNTASRVSWAFSQIYSLSTFAADNVTATPTKLCHLKFKYVDVNENPLVLFEEGGTYLDQFYTACGPAAGGAADTADCGAEPGTQLLNDTFDSGGATLSNEAFELFKGLRVYPNPASETIYITSGIPIEKIELYDIVGKQVLESKNTSEINVNHLEYGLYLLKLYSEKAITTKKIIIE